jgi:hypothetical protein
MKYYRGETYSWNMQEPFVLAMLQEKRNGYYVELGSERPYEASNTYLLESKFGWTGLPLELEQWKCDIYNESGRINKAVQGNAHTFNLDKYFEENNFPKQIDYLQIDVDHEDYPESNLLALMNVPLSRYRFSVITFEHDDMLSLYNRPVRDMSREILKRYGYELVVRDIAEDFWVDPNVVDKDLYRQYMGGHNRISQFDIME